jgi:hypothetical protein
MVTKQSLSVGSRESIGTLVFSTRQHPKLRELSREGRGQKRVFVLS